MKRELAKALGIQLDRYTPEGSHTKILRGLADLIDRPTCTIVCECDAYSSWGERIDGMRLYELSCWHQAVGFNRPDYCSKCGMEVVKRD